MAKRRLTKRAPSARSRGHIEQRQENVWRVKVYLGSDAQGRKKYASETVHGSWKDADKARVRMLGQQDVGTFVPRTKLTVEEYLEAWLNGKEGEEKTVRDYRTRLQNDVYPYLGGTKVADLKATQLKALYQKLKTRTSAQTGKPLSPRTIRYTHMILKQAFHHAVMDGLMATNPCLYIPRGELPKERRTRAITTWSPDELRSFLEWIRRNKPDHNAIWTLLSTTGMRPQEAMALKWDDLSHRNGIDYVTIRRALKATKAGGYEVSEYPKTDSAMRTISLPPSTRDALDQHRADHVTRPGEWIFGTRNGNPGSPSNLKRMIRSDVDACGLGLPRIRPYDLRHTHATNLMEKGVQLKVVQERLGHKDPIITQKFYQHAVPELDNNLAGQIEAALFG